MRKRKRGHQIGIEEIILKKDKGRLNIWSIYCHFCVLYRSCHAVYHKHTSSAVYFVSLRVTLHYIDILELDQQITGACVNFKHESIERYLSIYFIYNKHVSTYG